MSDEINPYPLDENGIEMRSLAIKKITPQPAPEDLTRVRTGSEPADYVYVDPCSLFGLQRLVASFAADPPKTKSQRYQRGKPFGKFVRELADQAIPHWPPGGYALRYEVGLSQGVEVEPEPASTSGLITDVPGAQVLGEDGRWRPVVPAPPVAANGQAPQPFEALVTAEAAPSAPPAAAAVVAAAPAEEWVPVYPDEDEGAEDFED